MMKLCLGVLSIVIYATSTQAGKIEECEGWPEPLLIWEGNCYKRYSEEKHWQKAEDHCISMGAHLASVHSAKENRLLYGLTYDGTSSWIGFRRIQSKNITGNVKESLWIWSDGSQTSYVNWKSANHPGDFAKLYHATGQWEASQ